MTWQNIIKAKVDVVQVVMDILEDLGMEYIEHDQAGRSGAHVKIYFRDPKKPNKILTITETVNIRESMKNNIKSTIKKLIAGRKRRGQGAFKLSEDETVQQDTWYNILKTPETWLKEKIHNLEQGIENAKKNKKATKEDIVEMLNELKEKKQQLKEMSK